MKQFFLAVLMLAVLAGTSMGQENGVPSPQVVLETSQGEIVLELYA